MRRLACTVAALGSAVPVAAETSRTFEVAARIVSGCLVATDAAGRWGAIDLGSAAGVAGSRVEAGLLSAAGAGIAIECTPGLAATLSADAGEHSLAGERRLRQAGGTATIGYRLYADGAATPWTTTPLPLAFAAGTRLVPVRAVATLDAPAAAGTYTDTVRLTLSW